MTEKARSLKQVFTEAVMLVILGPLVGSMILLFPFLLGPHFIGFATLFQYISIGYSLGLAPALCSSIFHIVTSKNESKDYVILPIFSFSACFLICLFMLFGRWSKMSKVEIFLALVGFSLLGAVASVIVIGITRSVRLAVQNEHGGMSGEA